MDAQTLPLVMLLEIAVRGGSASIGLLMAVLLLAVRPVREVTVFGALFFIGAASYAITAFDPVYDMLGGWNVPITLYWHTHAGLLLVVRPGDVQRPVPHAPLDGSTACRHRLAVPRLHTLPGPVAVRQEPAVRTCDSG